MIRGRRRASLLVPAVNLSSASSRTERGGRSRASASFVPCVQLAACVACVGVRQAPSARGPSGQGLHAARPRRDSWNQRSRGLPGVPAWSVRGRRYGHPRLPVLDLPSSVDVRPTRCRPLMLALGFPTTRKWGTSGRGSRVAVVRLLNRVLNARWLEEIGFISQRKPPELSLGEHPRRSRYANHSPVSRAHRIVCLTNGASYGRDDGVPSQWCDHAPARRAAA